MKYLFLFLLLVIFSSFQIDSANLVPAKKLQQINTSSIPVNDQPANKGEHKTNRFITDYEFILSAAVLVFAVIILVLEVYLIRLKLIDPTTALKFILVTLIITAMLFLITAGYTVEQISPGIGLLGTIAGYLLGKSENKEEKS